MTSPHRSLFIDPLSGFCKSTDFEEEQKQFDFIIINISAYIDHERSYQYAINIVCVVKRKYVGMCVCIVRMYVPNKNDVIA